MVTSFPFDGLARRREPEREDGWFGLILLDELWESAGTYTVRMASRPHRLATLFLFLCAALMAVPVIASVGDPDWAAVALFATLTLVTLTGGLTILAHRGVVSPTPATHSSWQALALIGALTLPWGMVIVASPHGSYFLFAMFALAQWILAPFPGLLTATALTIFTVGGQLIHHGLTPGAIIGPVAAFAFAVISLQGYRRILAESEAKTQLMKELEAAHNQLLDSEREASRLAERTRLGRDLHDTVAQSLASIQLLLHAAENDPDEGKRRRLIRQARASAAESLSETRSFITDLTPPDLQGRTLETALERVAERATDRGVAGELRVVGHPRSLGMRVEAALLRIAQEATENALQHSGALSVTITVDYTEPVTLSIDDDGSGFDVETVVDGPARGHFGVAGMRARAAEIGASCVIVSEPGESTLVHVSLGRQM